MRDAALMMNVISGPDPRDPVSLDSEPEDFLRACERDLKGLRVAWSEDFGYGAVDPEVRQLTRRAAQRFADLGCHVEEVTPTWDNPAWWAGLLWDVSTAIRNVERFEQHPDWFEPSMVAQIEHGRSASGAGAWAARSSRAARSTNRRASSWMASTCCSRRRCRWSPGPSKAPPTEIDGQPVPNLLDRLPFTFPFNMTGWPAASVPCGFNSEGLPVALQIVAGPRQDGLCLAASAAFEALAPWAERTPAL